MKYKLVARKNLQDKEAPARYYATPVWEGDGVPVAYQSVPPDDTSPKHKNRIAIKMNKL